MQQGRNGAMFIAKFGVSMRFSLKDNTYTIIDYKESGMENMPKGTPLVHYMVRQIINYLQDENVKIWNGNAIP